jgi:hypothetical protein
MSEALFSKPIAVITLSASDAMTNGYLIVERPRLITIEGEKYIRGRHAKSGVNAVQGRNVLIALSQVTTITEFDAPDEVQLGQARNG